MYIIYRDTFGTVRVELEPGCIISFCDGMAYFSAWKVQFDENCGHSVPVCYDMAVNVNDILEIGQE